MQSEYFNSIQITIFVTLVTYHHLDSTAADPKLVTEHHFFISDDKTHDADFSHLCLNRLLDTLVKERGVDLKGVHLFTGEAPRPGLRRHALPRPALNCHCWHRANTSTLLIINPPGRDADGGPAHFKNSSNFINLCDLADRRGVPICWNFFASAHGKGPWDGLGAVLKCFLRRLQLAEPNLLLNDAASVVRVCSERFTEMGKSAAAACRAFHLVTPEEVNTFPMRCANTLPGSRSFHSFLATPGVPTQDGKTVILVRPISCTCTPCLEGAPQRCEHAGYVPGWEEMKLTEKADKREAPIEMTPDEEDAETFLADFSLPYQQQLEKNMFVALKADNVGTADNEQFYILQVVGDPYEAKRTFKEKDKVFDYHVQKGDIVVQLQHLNK